MSEAAIVISEPGASQVQVSGGAPDTVVIVSDATASRVVVGRDSSDSISVVRPAYGNGLDGFPVNITSPRVGDGISTTTTANHPRRNTTGRPTSNTIARFPKVCRPPSTRHRPMSPSTDSRSPNGSCRVRTR